MAGLYAEQPLLTGAPQTNTSMSVLPIIGPIVDAAAGLLGMDSSAHYQRVNMRESARLQHEENQFWADYNKPENQMARLEAAGLNPNLVYGQGADAQYSGSVSPSGGMPSSPQFHIAADLLSLRQMSEQIKNYKKERELKDKEMATQDSIARKNQAEAAYTEAITPRAAEYQGSQIGVNESQKQVNLTHAENLKAQTEFTRLQSDYQRMFNHVYQEYGLYNARLDATNKELENAIKWITAEHLEEQIESQLLVNRETAREIAGRTAVAYAQAAELNSLEKLYNEQRGKVRSEHRGVVIENAIRRLKREYQENVNWIIDASKYGHVANAYIAPLSKLIHGGNETVSGLVGGGFMTP